MTGTRRKKGDDARAPRVEESLCEYVTSPAIALMYDRQHENTLLLTFDTQFLKENLPRAGRVLDVGCGTGRHVVTLSENGRQVVGMDLSRHMLDITAAKLERARLNAPLVQADMRAPLPFRDNTFDAAICMFSTIGLVPSAAGRLEFAKEVCRVLKPGGAFVVHVHNRLYNLFDHWGRAWLARTYTWDRLFSRLEVGDRVMPEYAGIKGMFLHIFSLGEVQRLLEGGGLAVKRAFYLNEERTGEVLGRFRSVRANGFILTAVKRRL